ncbi:clathrin heavy chain linker domain-containing protein 1 [Exaiptasia diaphana]|uniref:Translin-associated factor X-interacting protein 1 N-terminal domain-containing protein n=1 Tax=Exaiptasia diaphana TaxID=2652724 RepID=A0A913WZB1_EXADI|nr:clathrin heavy chain linker domain-containing protein 1 [Exaiptasia diaphana]KXJ16571.1 Clathrin heavy chain linker domain-containing protein 1 [Exaiptasia diaphana]
MKSLGAFDNRTRTRSKGSNSPSTPKTTSQSRGTRFGSRIKDYGCTVRDIETFIDDELYRLNYHPDTTPHDRYIVHKHAFDHLVEEKTVVYKPVLATIKAEYEDCINALEKGQSQAIYLQGMVKALLVEKSTLTQFVRRGDELEEKLEKLRAANKSLKSKVQNYREERERRLASARKKEMQGVNKKVQHTIPGLSVDELTDVPTLRRTLIKLEMQLNQLTEANETQYVEKEQKSVLKKQITKKDESLQDTLEQHNKLKERCDVMKYIVETSRKALANPHKDIHLKDVVTKALSDYGKSKYKKATNSLQQFISFDDDDPIKKKEAERMIEYCDHFNNLFDFGQYEAAAIHAANSPFGILRNYETLIRFKQADEVEGQRKPLLIFCDALMETACAAQPLTQAMSVECIKCALMEDCLDLATHWLAQGKLSYSIPLGEVLFEHCKCVTKCTCACTILAQTVYTHVGAHERAAKCLSKQQKYSTLLHYIQRYAKFQISDYKNLLQTAPSTDLAQLMLTTKLSSKYDVPVLTLANVASILLNIGEETILIQVMKNLQSQNNDVLQQLIKRIAFEEMDDMTLDRWSEVVGLCEKEGMIDVGIEILSAVTIGEALNRASIAFSMDYIS